MINCTRIKDYVIALQEKTNDALKAQIAELNDQNRDVVKVCHWSQDDEGTWNGTCGVEWYMTEGTPQENEMNYCTNCGAVLMETKQTKETDDE